MIVLSLSPKGKGKCTWWPNIAVHLPSCQISDDGNEDDNDDNDMNHDNDDDDDGSIYWVLDTCQKQYQVIYTIFLI